MAKKAKTKKAKDTSVIPKGDYCYRWIKGTNKYGLPNTKYCPYSTTKEYDGVIVPYCSYLDLADAGDVTEEEHKKLLEHFGSEEKMDKEFPMSLLWDSIKACGINEYTEEEMLEKEEAEDNAIKEWDKQNKNAKNP